MGWDNGNQLTEQHKITQRESTQNIRGALRDAKDKGENKGRAGETRASAAAIAAQAPLLCK